MRKILIQGTIIVLLFFGTWFVLTQKDWVDIFEVRTVTANTEQKLGELFWEVLQSTEEVNENIHVLNSIDSILVHICLANKIDREAIKVHVISKDDINAFVLPNGHLIIYTGLLQYSESQEELTGVLCHEIAHVELNHVMKKLIKEIGLSVLVSMTTGNSGGEIIKEITKMLSSSAFDRNLEKEADIEAVSYLTAAKVNPEPFANFLYRLSYREDDAKNYLTIISTHPDSKERAEYIIECSKNNIKDYEPILSIETWEKLKTELYE